MRAVKLIHNIPTLVCEFCHGAYPCKHHPTTVGTPPPPVGNGKASLRMLGEGTRKTTCTHGYHACMKCDAPKDEAKEDNPRLITLWADAVVAEGFERPSAILTTDTEKDRVKFAVCRRVGGKQFRSEYLVLGTPKVWLATRSDPGTALRVIAQRLVREVLAAEDRESRGIGERWARAVREVSGYVKGERSPWEATVEPVTLGFTLVIKSTTLGVMHHGCRYLSHEEEERYSDYQLRVLVQNIFDEFRKEAAEGV